LEAEHLCSFDPESYHQTLEFWLLQGLESNVNWKEALEMQQVMCYLQN
jgi:hypothetical protein